MKKSKRGRITQAGAKIRQGRPRQYARMLGAKAAFNCEQALELRCRCRCRGRLHGAQRDPELIDGADPHALVRDYCAGDCNCRQHAAALRRAAAAIARRSAEAAAPSR